MTDRLKQCTLPFVLMPLAFWTTLQCSLFGQAQSSDNDALALLAALPSESSDSQACLAGWPFASGAYLADRSLNAAVGAGTFDDPTKATNGICGSGWGSGSADVYSLGSSSECETSETCIVLEWNARRVDNATGLDLVVYENPFQYGSPNVRFMEAVIVEVSEDGTNWCGWDPQYSGSASNADLRNPALYSDLAGLTPVEFKQSSGNTLSAADLFTEITDEKGTHLKGGGDGFDLDATSFGTTGSGCSTARRDALRSTGFVYVRLTTAHSRNAGSYPLPSDSFDQKADIDGVVAKSVSAR